MALADGDRVILTVQPIIDIGPRRIRGCLAGVVAGVSGNVFWENGETQLAVPIDCLATVSQLVGVVPPDVLAIVGQHVHPMFPAVLGVPRQAQELGGVVSDVYTATADDGAVTGHIAILLTGRGDGGFPMFLDLGVWDSATFTTPFTIPSILTVNGSHMRWRY